MRDRAVPHELAAFGEISLAGEVRPVTSAKQRGSEARRLGYTTILDVEAGSVRAAVERAMIASSSARERELDAAF
jgi:DNA repair protein RadA/Sms